MYRFIPSSMTQVLMMFISTISSIAFAESPRWYEVEVALIGYQDSQKINNENWPEILINEQPAEQAGNEKEDRYTKDTNPWAWLDWWNSSDKEKHNLYHVQTPHTPKIKPAPRLQTPFISTGTAFEDKAGKFKRTKGLQVVWSQKWQQPIPEKDDATQVENAVKINIRTPLNFKKSLKSAAPLIEAEVTGAIYLYRSRYLHLVSELNVQHWQSLNSSSSLDKSIDILPNHPQKGLNIIPSKSSTPLTAINEIPLRAASINQSRRMRSNELHYIDHPLLGILVRVTPLADVSE